MPRIKKPKAIETFINGQPATVPEIIEDVGGDKWKEHIEVTGGSEAKDRYLRSKLGVYIAEDEAHEKNITARVLAVWRRKGLLRWEQIDSKYYYSRDSVLKVLKTIRTKIHK